MRQPGFVSSSYFLRFKFDEGRDALAGREKIEGRNLLRVEYYPTGLYDATTGGVGQTRTKARSSDRRKPIFGGS